MGQKKLPLAEGKVRVAKVHALVPAGGYIARLGESRIPIAAWAYVRFEEGDASGEPIAFDGWDGVGIWNDGPEFLSIFPEFKGYEPVDNRT